MSSGKRVVFDASTLIGAVLKPQSVPAEALSWGWEVAEIVVSAETLEELRLVLGRERLDAYREREARQKFFELYQAMTVLVPVAETVVACRDPRDDKFLSLAVGAGASLLVSSDDDLLALGQYRGGDHPSPQGFRRPVRIGAGSTQGWLGGASTVRWPPRVWIHTSCAPASK